MTKIAVNTELVAPSVRVKGILRAPALLGLAAVALGAALQVNYGQYHPISLQLLTISLGAAGLAIFKIQDRSFPNLRVEEDSLLPRVLLVGILFQFALLLVADPTAQTMASAELRIFRIGIIIAAASACLCCSLSPRARVRVRGNDRRPGCAKETQPTFAPHPNPLPEGEGADTRTPDFSRCRSVLWMLLPVIHFLLGLWVLRCVPPPPVDICVFQQDACRALLHGIDPYSIHFPNLYANPAKMYDASLVDNGRLLFGFPYPPLSLLLILPGYLAGDFRIAQLAAMSLAGAMIMFGLPGDSMRRRRLGRCASIICSKGEVCHPEVLRRISVSSDVTGHGDPSGYLRMTSKPPLPVGERTGSRLCWPSAPHPIAALAGVLFLFTPRAFFIVEAGFTEPLVVMLLAAVVVAAPRRWRCLPVLFGLFLVSKQYLILAAPLGLLLFSEPDDEVPMPLSQRLKPWLIAAGTAGVVTLPLAFWNLSAFLKSVVFLQFHQPIRPDSLSYLPNLIDYTGWRPLLAMPFVLAIVLIVICLRRLPKSPAAFSAGFGFLFLVFFATNKQAFCGYYLTVIAALCISIAAMRDPEVPSY